MIKAAIFDLDGTIGDTVESIAYSGNRALRDIGYQAFPVENYKYYAGDGVDELVRRTLRDSGDTNCSQFEQMKSIYKAYFAKDCMYHVKPFPGICEMLSELKKRGIRIAVLSNKPHAQAIDVVESLFGKDPTQTRTGRSVCHCRKVCSRDRRMSLCRRYKHGHADRQCGTYASGRGSVGIPRPKRIRRKSQ